MGSQLKSELPVWSIRPISGWQTLDLRELWSYRDLLYFLAWRDVKVRYKQTLIGVAWAVLQPIAMVLVFTLIFGRYAHVPSEGTPYVVFALVGQLPWQLFSRMITESTNSLITDQRLITKVYFPRIFVPIAVGLAAFVDLLIAGVVLLVLMLFWGLIPGTQVIWLPAFCVLMLIAALAVGLWLSALNVEYRDVMYTIPFLNQLWFFATPVVYPTSIIPERLRFVYALNPMVGVIDGFRWALLRIGPAPFRTVIPSVCVAVVLCVTGIMWFRRREAAFVDSIGSGG